ncbi:MAG: hypothetical protein ACI915_003309 [Gammaproteobacteria bacterium]
MQQKIILMLTLMLTGRAMTLAFIHRAGGGLPGDPPAAWLMPLIGDAVIGVSGLWIAYLILKKTGLFVWSAIIVWNSLAIWDALSAFAIHTTNPWPEFFMIKLVGSSMFFAASAMHLAIIFIATSEQTRRKLLGQI